MKRVLEFVGLMLVAAAALAGDVTSGEQIISDPGFETGLITISLSDTPSAICTPPKPIGCRIVSSATMLASSTSFKSNSGSKYITFGGRGMAHVDFLSQLITISAADAATLRFYLQIATKERTTKAVDILRLEIRTESGQLLETLAIYSNLGVSGGYRELVFDFSRYAGQTVRIVFVATEDHSQPTWFLLDDLTLTVSR